MMQVVYAEYRMLLTVADSIRFVTGRTLFLVQRRVPVLPLTDDEQPVVSHGRERYRPMQWQTLLL